MIQQFLALQQKRLNELGQQRGQWLQRLALEQKRETQMAVLLSQMGQTLDLRQGLVRENYYQMRRNMEQLRLQQQEKVAQLQQELNSLEETLREQIGKVKGLELVLKQRAMAATAQDQRRQQQHLDEFNTVRYCRGA